MKVLDLFCGTKSIAHAFEQRGHEVFTVDWNSEAKEQWAQATLSRQTDILK
jgi:site-specific DNA-cytosine methylase